MILAEGDRVHQAVAAAGYLALAALGPSAAPMLEKRHSTLAKASDAARDANAPR